MPSMLHEVLIELFRHRPEVVTDLLADQFELKVPTWHQSRIESGEITELVPTEYRADSVFVFSDLDGPVIAVVLEVQLRRDPDKRWSWPVYLSGLRARLRCPTLLLVVSPDESTATWCATPIEMGHPEWALRPLVLGPDQLEVLMSTEAETYRDYLSPFVNRFVERGRREGEAVGEARGKATALLTILATRGVVVSDATHTRITECTDLAQLETWVRRAATADSVEELFD